MRKLFENKLNLVRRAGILLGTLAFVLTGCGRANVTVPEDEIPQIQIQEQSQENTQQSAQTSENTTASDTTLTITAIKEGAADAFVLISGDHVTIIDTGLEKKSDRLIDFLNGQGVTRVDEMIITHFDKDHVGGADHVIDNYEVGTIYTTYQSKDSDDITSYREAMERKGLSETVVSKETTFNAGDISFTIYPPLARSYTEKISNNSSLVIKVTLGEKSMLFAGDAEAERIKELLATKGIQCDVLKVPHHGRYAPNSEAFIDYVNPGYAIITSGKSETEDQEILDILAKKGIKTYFTRDGNITINMTSDGITISQ